MTTQEKSFWHKTKEVGDNLWKGTKTVTEDVWEGTKNVAGNIKNAFTSDDEEDLHEEIRYSANAVDDDIYDDFEIKTKTKAKNKNHPTKH